jgi:hypothetical protein
MEHDIGAMHRVLQCLRIQQIAANQAEVGHRMGRVEEPFMTCREVVEANHVMPLIKQAIDEVAPDESGTARYKAVQEGSSHHEFSRYPSLCTVSF